MILERPLGVLIFWGCIIIFGLENFTSGTLEGKRPMEFQIPRLSCLDGMILIWIFFLKALLKAFENVLLLINGQVLRRLKDQLGQPPTRGVPGKKSSALLWGGGSV